MSLVLALSKGKVTTALQIDAKRRAVGFTKSYYPNLVNRLSLKKSNGPVNETFKAICLTTFANDPLNWLLVVLS